MGDDRVPGVGNVELARLLVDLAGDLREPLEPEFAALAQAEPRRASPGTFAIRSRYGAKHEGDHLFVGLLNPRNAPEDLGEALVIRVAGADIPEPSPDRLATDASVLDSINHGVARGRDAFDYSTVLTPRGAVSVLTTVFRRTRFGQPEIPGLEGIEVGASSVESEYQRSLVIVPPAVDGIPAEGKRQPVRVGLSDGSAVVVLGLDDVSDPAFDGTPVIQALEAGQYVMLRARGDYDDDLRLGAPKNSLSNLDESNVHRLSEAKTRQKLEALVNDAFREVAEIAARAGDQRKGAIEDGPRHRR